MTSHKRTGSCCRRHSKRSFGGGAVAAKKDNTKVGGLATMGTRMSGRPLTQSEQSEMDLVLAKVPWRLPLRQKPNGVWSYRFGKPFRKLRQSSISDYERDPEDLILDQISARNR